MDLFYVYRLGLIDVVTDVNRVPLSIDNTLNRISLTEIGLHFS